MKPYGVKKNWNAVEEQCKNGHGESAKSHTKTKKVFHRIARRTWKNQRKTKTTRAGQQIVE